MSECLQRFMWGGGQGERVGSVDEPRWTSLSSSTKLVVQDGPTSQL